MQLRVCTVQLISNVQPQMKGQNTPYEIYLVLALIKTGYDNGF